MQKVESSSLFSRLIRKPRNAGLSAARGRSWGGKCGRRYHSVLPDTHAEDADAAIERPWESEARSRRQAEVLAQAQLLPEKARSSVLLQRWQVELKPLRPGRTKISE
jgi:hypothetical protein